MPPAPLNNFSEPQPPKPKLSYTRYSLGSLLQPAAMEPAMPHEFGQDGAAAQYLAAPGSKEDFDIYTLK